MKTPVRVKRSLLAAVVRISKGDFRTRVELVPIRGANNHPFVQLAHNLNDMAAELGRLEVMRQELISDVSHELQSPLTSIRGFAKALQEEDLAPADRQRYLEIIQIEAERLSRLSDNLLRLTALEADARTRLDVHRDAACLFSTWRRFELTSRSSEAGEVAPVMESRSTVTPCDVHAAGSGRRLHRARTPPTRAAAPFAAPHR